ncbi:MobC family plasmid mobilization relaxosome protein [Sphingomonas sp. LB-2]|uniref:MobC family plasmid mobilization relaxosome protein n=1 Tax=Sphingomonas caeni TaxID=2984949 RepID=UPI0022311FAA|nr:MobC family plasmid mobilization relaxosome protein [Sphingomonas caeni]MCW3847379.1 MobC family plasmid mobilization relaxosome protein [Sphingomonas caeni]
MSAANPSRLAPLSLRLSREERARLERAAGAQPLGTYIKSRLFGDGVVLMPARSRKPVRDERTLAQLLARLGSSRMASNLNQLAHAANIGALDCDEEIATALAAACADIRAMRLMLMTALGSKSPTPAPSTAPPRQAFADADSRERQR